MKIRIKSFDIDGQKYENEFKVTNNVRFSQQKEYFYNDEFGKCKIVDNDEYVEIFRNGLINSKQIFKLNVKTSFMYITREFKGKYTILTRKFERDNSKISLLYDIMDQENIINTVNLEISYL